MYSRRAASVEEHAEKVKKSGSGKFMERYYVGYGHASIADCGSTTVFIEGVSMLVAKAVQDWPLYSGQETSSRYIDMSKQEIKDPVGTKASKAILNKWMKFYTENQAAVEIHLRQKYPRKPEEDEGVYDRAIKARIFDILRGFLPAGATTQLSWHTNLRQAHDKLSLLHYYPLDEVKSVAKEIHEKLKEKYPHSFGHKQYPEQEAYRKYISEKYTYYYNKDAKDFSAKTNIKNAELMQYKDVLKKRPMKTNLPLFLGELGNVTFEFLLDFGSFRDIHRHRNGVCRMPLLTTNLGFHEWYLEQLPANVRMNGQKLIKEQVKAIKALKASKEETQYYVAMGFNVACKVTYGLPATVYTMELRSGRLVHATLRRIAHKMYAALHKMFPELTLHPDLDKDDWDIRRGMQDIKEKK
nr:Thymidylate synthase complementing protein [uncultured bacterium]